MKNKSLVYAATISVFSFSCYASDQQSLITASSAEGDVEMGEIASLLSTATPALNQDDAISVTLTIPRTITMSTPHASRYTMISTVQPTDKKLRKDFAGCNDCGVVCTAVGGFYIFMGAVEVLKRVTWYWGIPVLLVGVFSATRGTQAGLFELGRRAGRKEVWKEKLAGVERVIPVVDSAESDSVRQRHTSNNQNNDGSERDIEAQND